MHLYLAHKAKSKTCFVALASLEVISEAVAIALYIPTYLGVKTYEKVTGTKLIDSLLDEFTSNSKD